MTRVMMHAVSEQHVKIPGALPTPGPEVVDDAAGPRLAAIPATPAAKVCAEQASTAPTSSPRPVAGAIPSTAHAKLAELVNAHFQIVWRTLRRLGLSEADADDGAQQVFLIVAQKLHVIESDKERAFLVGVAYRVAANARRAVSKHRHEEFNGEHSTHDPVMPAHQPAQNPEELLQRRQKRALLDEVLESMPLPQRSVFVLFELEGMTTPEIAESLGVALGTAASRLRRARELFVKESQRVRARLHLDPKQGGNP